MSHKAGPSEGASLDGEAGRHGNAVAEGISTAISWLTIIPLRGARVFDRITGRRAIAALPVAGLVPGLAAALLVAMAAGGPWDPVANPLAPMVIGVLVVCLAEWLTRGMHLDGLADIADALGSYRGPAEARKVLADPATGPMGAGAVALALMAQAAAFGALAADAMNANRLIGVVRSGTAHTTNSSAGNASAQNALAETASAANIVPSDGATGGAADGAAGIVPDIIFPGPLPSLVAAILVVALPYIFARAAAMTACHRSFPRMSDSGFGSLTAGTQPGWSVLLWWAVLAALGFVVAGISGVITALVVAAFTWWFTRRVVKRLGGVNGDALGAIVQVSTAIAAVMLALG